MPSDPVARSRPLNTIRVGGKSVSIFAPTTGLWVELNELHGQEAGEAWPYILRTPPGSVIPCFATRTMHVLEVVLRHCSDAEFCAPAKAEDDLAPVASIPLRPNELGRLVHEIIGTWSSNRAHYREYVSVLLETWVKEQLGLGAFLDYALDPNPHPKVVSYMGQLGAEAARRALATPAREPEPREAQKTPLTEMKSRKRPRGNPGLPMETHSQMVKDYGDWKTSRLTQLQYVRMKRGIRGMSEKDSLTYLERCRKQWCKANRGK